MSGENIFYIHVKVKTEANKEKLLKKNKDHFEISVKEKAERNMANMRVLKIISEYFSVPLGRVRIVNGHRHSSKLLVVD
jgi:uncharacterized protein YggU (UPF0235/DUF167 family)